MQTLLYGPVDVPSSSAAPSLVLVVKKYDKPDVHAVCLFASDVALMFGAVRHRNRCIPFLVCVGESGVFWCDAFPSCLALWRVFTRGTLRVCAVPNLVQCTYGSKERLVRLIKETPSGPVPCRNSSLLSNTRGPAVSGSHGSILAGRLVVQRPLVPIDVDGRPTQT